MNIFYIHSSIKQNKLIVVLSVRYSTKVVTPIERNKVNMPEDESMSAAAVCLKLAEFFPHNAAFWFILAEQHVHINGISKDETMYAHVVSSLKEDVSVRVMSLLLNPPATGKYDARKQLLLPTFPPPNA